MLLESCRLQIIFYHIYIHKYLDCSGNQNIFWFDLWSTIVPAGTPWPSPTSLFPWTRQTFTATRTSTVSCRQWWRFQPTFCRGLCFAGVPDDWVFSQLSSWEECFYSSYSSYQQVWPTFQTFLISVQVEFIWKVGTYNPKQCNAVFPVDLIYVSISLEMMGKFAVTTAFALAYAYTAEVYPTVLRNSAVGACSMASRIGSITAPYFIYLSKDDLTSASSTLFSVCWSLWNQYVSLVDFW